MSSIFPNQTQHIYNPSSPLVLVPATKYSLLTTLTTLPPTAASCLPSDPPALASSSHLSLPVNQLVGLVTNSRKPQHQSATTSACGVDGQWSCIYLGKTGGGLVFRFAWFHYGMWFSIGFFGIILLCHCFPFWLFLGVLALLNSFLFNIVCCYQSYTYRLLITCTPFARCAPDRPHDPSETIYHGVPLNYTSWGRANRPDTYRSWPNCWI